MKRRGSSEQQHAGAAPWSGSHDEVFRSDLIAVLLFYGAWLGGSIALAVTGLLVHVKALNVIAIYWFLGTPSALSVVSGFRSNRKGKP